MHIGVGGRRHLQTLHLRSSDIREEYRNFGPFHSGETLHRRRAGITARCGEDKNASAAGGMLHEHGEHRKRHILERTGLAVKKFKDLETVRIDERNRIVLRETRQKPIDRGGPHLGGKIVKEFRHYILFTRTQIVKRATRLKPVLHRLKQRHVQSAVRSQSLKNTFRARRLEPFSR